MTTRTQDKIIVENQSGQSMPVDQCEITHSLMEPSECTLTLGDDGAWNKLYRDVAPSSPLTVYIDGAIQITGRAEILDVTADDAGMKIKVTIRTKLSDAKVASADTRLSTSDVTIEKFLDQLFTPLGLGSSIFIDGNAMVDLLSGKKGPGGGPQSNLESLNAKKAKVQPGESIHDCATRHLERHGLIMLDGPDGKIYVVRPNVFAEPRYRFQVKRGTAKDCAGNNLLKIRKTEDWTDVPSELWMYGLTYGGELHQSTLYSVAVNANVAVAARNTGHFNRRLVGQRNELKTKDQTDARAWREMSALRSKQDAWELTMDGLSHWDGQNKIKLAPAATCTVDCDVAGTPKGLYFIHKVRLLQDEKGSIATVAVVRSDLVQTKTDKKYDAATTGKPPTLYDAKTGRFSEAKK